MSKTKFTNGNFSDGTTGWKVNILKRDIHPDWIEIIFNDDEECVVDQVYELSDAHLIAAAPEMYEALSNIENDNNIIPAPIWHMIKSALVKADGRQP
jgi:hypothetical protein